MSDVVRLRQVEDLVELEDHEGLVSYLTLSMVVDVLNNETVRSKLRRLVFDIRNGTGTDNGTNGHGN